MNGAVNLDDVVGKLPHSLPVADVHAMDRDALPGRGFAELALTRRAIVLAQVDEREMAALVPERKRQCAIDPVRGAGDHGDATRAATRRIALFDDAARRLPEIARIFSATRPPPQTPATCRPDSPRGGSRS